MLKADDVVLADRYFSGWFDIALLRQRGVHIVVRKHQCERPTFAKGSDWGITIISYCGANPTDRNG